MADHAYAALEFFASIIVVIIAEQAHHYKHCPPHSMQVIVHMCHTFHYHATAMRSVTLSSDHPIIYLTLAQHPEQLHQVHLCRS